MAYFYKYTKKTVIPITNLFRVPLPYNVPVHGRPQRLQVSGAAVLVVQVVGVLPYVEGEEGLEAVGYRIVCIGALENGQFAILVGGEPHPSAPKQADAFGFEIGLEGFEGAPLPLDLGKETACRGRQRRLQSELREVQVVVQDLAGVVENGPARSGNNLLQRLALILRPSNEFIQIIHIRLQMLSMVERQRLIADNRGQRLVGEVNECEHISVSFENVAGINLVCNIVQGQVVAVGDDGIGLGLEGGQIIDDT